MVVLEMMFVMTPVVMVAFAVAIVVTFVVGA